MAQIVTMLSDRARREGVAEVGRADLGLVEELELGQVVIIEDTSTGDRLLGWVSDVFGADTETVYRLALGPVLPRARPRALPRPRKRYGLQDVESLLGQARAEGIPVPRPRLTPEGVIAQDD
jgi:hypothetical protein